MTPRASFREVMVREVLRTCTADARLELCNALGVEFGQRHLELSGDYYSRLVDGIINHILTGQATVKAPASQQAAPRNKCADCGVTLYTAAWSAEVPWCDECRARAEGETV